MANTPRLAFYIVNQALYVQRLPGNIKQVRWGLQYSFDEGNRRVDLGLIRITRLSCQYWVQYILFFYTIGVAGMIQWLYVRGVHTVRTKDDFI